jgi:O-antigen/teichoic acid export membrane protein
MTESQKILLPKEGEVAKGKTAGEFLFLNSASSAGFRAIAGMTRIGILLSIARAYGPGSFGQLSLAMSLVEILRTFSEFGVDTISIRKFSQTGAGDRAHLLASIAGTKLILGACFYSLGMGVLFLIANNRATVRLGAIAALSLFFASVLGAISSYLQSSFSMSRILKTTLLSSTFSIAWASIAISSKAPLLVVIACLPAADALNLLLLSRVSGVSFRLKFSFSQTVGLLRESLPVGIMAVMVVLYVRLDNIFVFKFAGESALGLYALCYRITEPGLTIPLAFATTTYAYLSRPEHQEIVLKQAALISARTMGPAYLLTLAALAIVAVMGRTLLAWIFPRYLAAYPILLVLAFVVAARTINVALTSLLNSRAKYSLLAKICAVNLSVNIVLVFLLVPKLGALGAAWAALGTESINMLMQGKAVLWAFAGRRVGTLQEPFLWNPQANELE